MHIRAATIEDAPALGRAMVPSWLSAHRGQVPDAAWQKRVAEWTPEVSGQAWARRLQAQADGSAPHDVLLVAEDDLGSVVALVLGSPGENSSGGTAEVSALYVLPAFQRQGVGSALLRACAAELQRHGFSRLRLSVLTANLPARRFYAATGGHEVDHGTVDEEGHLLAAIVYEWPDIDALVGGGA